MSSPINQIQEDRAALISEAQTMLAGVSGFVYMRELAKRLLAALTVQPQIVGYYIIPVQGNPADDLWDGTVHRDLFSAEMSLATADKRDWYEEGEKAKWQIVGLVPVVLGDTEKEGQ